MALNGAVYARRVKYGCQIAFVETELLVSLSLHPSVTWPRRTAILSLRVATMNGVSLRFFDLEQIATCMDSELTMQSMQGDDHPSRAKHQAMG